MSSAPNTSLARLRRAEGLSIEAVAELAGVEVEEAASWEDGGPIAAEHRALLAARFGVEEDELTEPLSLPTAVTRRPRLRARRFGRRGAARPRLAKLRRAEGLGVDELADELGVSPGDVAGWESDGTIPDEHIGALVRRFGVSEDWLLGRESLSTDVIADGDGPA